MSGKIRLTEARDAKPPGGVTRAQRAKSASRIGLVRVLVLGGLLVLPGVALWRRGVSVWWVVGYAIVMNRLTFWVYSLDKNRARNGEWRIAEVRLHLLELLGGWPAAFVAQQWLRHKCSKSRYLNVFWLIIFSYQFAALDSLLDWRLSKAAANWAERTSAHRR